MSSVGEDDASNSGGDVQIINVDGNSDESDIEIKENQDDIHNLVEAEVEEEKKEEDPFKDEYRVLDTLRREVDKEDAQKK